MTGFGTGEAVLGAGRLVAEIRSVNHRFVDVRVRVPPELVDHAFFAEQRVRARCSRGRYDVSVRAEGNVVRPRLDSSRVRTLYAELCSLCDELAPGTEVPLAAALSLPELVVAQQTGGGDPTARDALDTALGQGLDRLDEMRLVEGTRLAEELRGRLGAARRVCSAVRDRIPSATQAVVTRLRERVGRVVADSELELDPGRMETEIALFADRSDVSEELVRLDSHFDQFEKLLSRDEPVGRRLDFLLQEIGREANTVGAKCQHAQLSHLVVELKADVERMREQVQNVE